MRGDASDAQNGDAVKGGSFEGEKVGEVKHYFDKISVVVVEPEKEINIGDTIRIYDKEGDVVVEQKVESMQIDGVDIDKSEKGQSFGLKVEGPVKKGYFIYRI